jgi:hypothetical protein
MHDEANVGRLASMSERELDLLLGEVELSGVAGGKDVSEAEKIGLGRTYFTNLLPIIRQQICGNTAIESVLAQKHKERNDIIIAVGGLLTGISPVPYVLAARVLHFGYKQLCPNPQG